MTQKPDNPTPKPPEPTAPPPRPETPGPGLSWFASLSPNTKAGLGIFVVVQIIVWVLFFRNFAQEGQAVTTTWQALALATLSLLALMAILLPTFRWLRREHVAYGLLAASALYLWVPLWIGFATGDTSKEGHDYLAEFFPNVGRLWPVFFWAILNAVLLLGAGFWLLFGEPPVLTREFEITSLGVVLALAGLGSTTALLGLLSALGIESFRDVFTSNVKDWGEHWREVTFAAVAIFGALGLMFVGLQFGRTLERTSAGMRRLVYGFNAVLTGLLLFTVLAVINLAMYLPNRKIDLGAQVDWSASQLHSIEPATENFIKGLEKPVKIYVFMGDRDLLREESERLLQTFKSHNPKITYEVYSPYTQTQDVRDLAAKYQLKDPLGLLVVYGPETSEVSTFIDAQELYELKDDRRRGEDEAKKTDRSFTFKGEAALKKALTFLADDKRRPVVYFVQDRGVPDLMPAFGGFGRGGAGYTQLRDRLTRQNYDVKALDFRPAGGAGPEKVPDDAEIVVVGGLITGLPPNAVKALTEYMNPTDPGKKKGKMVVMLDVMSRDDGRPVFTGLEAMLAQFGVTCPPERFISAETQSPTMLRIWPDFLGARSLTDLHPIAQAFLSSRGQPTTFVFDDVRPVVYQEAANPRGGSRFAGRSFLITDPNMLVWKTDKLTNPKTVRTELIEVYKKNQRDERVADQSGATVAVAVAEPAFGGMMGHPQVGGRQDVPRLIVVGNSRWVSDEVMPTATGKTNGDLFLSCLSWLRERKDLGAQPDAPADKPRKEFNLADASSGTLSRLRWLPLGLILIGLAGMGGGIWALRRR